jgi:hypothetical protein
VLAVGVWGRFIGTSRDRFAAQALRIARRWPGVDRVRYDAGKFGIAAWRSGADAPIWIFLSNVYGECQGVPRAERRERLERLMRIMAASPGEDTWESVRARLRPVLRPVTFGHVGVPGMVPPVSRSALPYLRELVVVDRPDSMVYVMPGQLDSWGVSVDDVFDAARANLDQLATRSLRDTWPADGSLVRMVDSGDGYFTSLLLAPGWLAGVSERVGAPVVAFVPDTATVVLCAVPAAGLAGLYEIVEEEYVAAVRGLSPVGYLAGDRGVARPYAPPAGHPDALAARRAEVVLAATEYGAQTRWLADQYEQAGMDVFVAQLLAAARPGQPAITVATWTDGIVSLLPEAQFISFTRDGVSGPRVPWQAVADLVDLRPEPLLAPVRYRVGDWPAPDVMDALRAHATD